MKTRCIDYGWPHRGRRRTVTPCRRASLPSTPPRWNADGIDSAPRIVPIAGGPEAALITGDPANRAYVLYELDAPAAVDAALTLADGTVVWERRVAERASGGRHVLELSPDADLPAARLGFADRFSQRVGVELRTAGGSAHASLDVCDARRLGTLYRRLTDRLVVPDAARQGVPTESHPWFPALAIGDAKAALHTRALIGDIVHGRRRLSDPGWLLRVCLQLEFLTFLGICAAVPEAELLSASEHAAVERFADLGERIDPAAWRAVWELHRDPLAKRRATLAFLRAHHRDLRHAIELAGPSPHDAQEAWRRVFRDAERAVLARTSAAFPELAGSPELEDLSATVCAQYRASMNDVAAHAGLIEYTGAECIPASASLFSSDEHLRGGEPRRRFVSSSTRARPPAAPSFGWLPRARTRRRA